MTHDVVQWLNEIRSLQEQLTRINQERSEAYQQASRWHQSYQTEASQRRADVHRLQQQIHNLVAENQRLKLQLNAASAPVMPPPPPQVPQAPETDQGADASTMHPPEQLEALRQKLNDATVLSDRLSQALRQEQRDHAQTRQTLMGALSDTIEQLERERHRQTAPKAITHAKANSKANSMEGKQLPSLPPTAPKNP